MIGNNAAVGFENQVFDQFDAAEVVGVLGIDRHLGLIEPELSVNEIIVANETVLGFYSFLKFLHVTFVWNRRLQESQIGEHSFPSNKSSKFRV